MSVSKKLEAHKYDGTSVNFITTEFANNNITDDKQKEYLLKYFYSKSIKVEDAGAAKKLFTDYKDEALKQYKNDQIIKYVGIGLAATLGLGIVGYVGFRVYKSRADN